MPENNRKKLLDSVETLVVKVGSRVLAAADGSLDTEQVGRIAAQLAQLADQGKKVVLVSSGAVAAGVDTLGFTERPTSLSKLQAAASVGQVHLMQAYNYHFKKHGRHAAQILLISDDLDDRARYLNVRNTLSALLEMGVIPIINENDSVAVDELLTTFGDNDRLASVVAGIFSHPAVVILSDVDGVYDRDPQQPDARLIDTIEQVDEQVMDMAAVSTSTVSKGGMASKLRAAKLATHSGAPVVIAGGRVENVLLRLLDGESLGTLFLPREHGLIPRKRWIGSAIAAGKITVDDGAVLALQAEGASLLAIGITTVDGSFEMGEVVTIHASDGREVGRGLCNYSAWELQKICGLPNNEIDAMLGHRPYEAVVHRDNLVILPS